MLWARSTTEDDIRDENKIQSISTLFIPRSLYYKCLFLKPQLKIISTISERKLRKRIIYILRACLYSELIQHGNPHQLFVIMSRMTYFIMRADTRTGVSHSQHRKNSGEVLEKCRWIDWKRRINQEEMPGSRRSIHGYMLTTPGVKGRTFDLWVLFNK